MFIAVALSTVEEGDEIESAVEAGAFQKGLPARAGGSICQWNMNSSTTWVANPNSIEYVPSLKPSL